MCILKRLLFKTLANEFVIRVLFTSSLSRKNFLSRQVVLGIGEVYLKVCSSLRRGHNTLAYFVLEIIFEMVSITSLIWIFH